MEEKTHVLKTIAKSTYFINERQYLAAMESEMTDKLNFGEVMLFAHQIAEIVTVDEYYRQNPDERPEKLPEFLLPSGDTPRTKEELSTARNHMIGGFKRYFECRTMPDQSKKLLKKWESRLFTEA